METLLDASLYKPLFLAIVAILTLLISQKYLIINQSVIVNNRQGDTRSIIVVIFFILFIGLRPLSGIYFVDMANYNVDYNVFYDGVKFKFDFNAENLLFDNLFAFWGSRRLGIDHFFLFVSVVYFGCAYLGIRRIFPEYKLEAYLVFLAALSTFSYGTNGIKAGAAASIFIWAYSYRDRILICIPLVLLSWGFHHSMQLPVAAFVLSLFFKNTKWYFYGWIACFLIAILHITAFQELFAGMSDEHGATYLIGSGPEGDGTKGGFRIDFIIYSSMPILVGYYTIFRKRLKVSEKYRQLINFYLFTNGIWMLCMYASFTNRIAYLSWFMYPIVLIYPILYEQWGCNKYKVFSYVMLTHLGFTLFMMFIYY